MTKGILISFIYIFGIIGIATILNNRKIISGEGSRKFIHIMLSNWWFIAMYYFKTPLRAAIVPAIFVVVNFISYKSNVFSAMERSKEENSLGTIYYAISLLVLTLTTFARDSSPWIGAAGVLVMGYGDGFAAIIGRRYGKHEYRFKNIKKTIEGSMGMFLFSFLSLLMILIFTRSLDYIGYAILISIIATILEAVSPKGIDNLTVPLVVSLFYYVLVF